MIILGLTGSIAMGKSAVADLCREAGYPVHDADRTVHQLMRPDGKAFAAIAAAFPDVIDAGEINRQHLGRHVFGQPENRAKLEAILHPLVRQDRDDWLSLEQQKGTHIAVLDIPLLYETGAEKDCDAVMVASASRWQQKCRALTRSGMTVEKLDAILDAQIDDTEKRARADFVVPTSFGVDASRWYLKRIFRSLTPPEDQHHA